MGEPLIPNGYVLVARKTLESGIFSKPPLYLKVWVYLLSHAQHKDFRGLKRGQLRTSIPEMQDALSWKVGYRNKFSRFLNGYEIQTKGYTKGTTAGL